MKLLAWAILCHHPLTRPSSSPFPTLLYRPKTFILPNYPCDAILSASTLASQESRITLLQEILLIFHILKGYFTIKVNTKAQEYKFSSAS